VHFEIICADAGTLAPAESSSADLHVFFFRYGPHIPSQLLGQITGIPAPPHVVARAVCAHHYQDSSMYASFGVSPICSGHISFYSASVGDRMFSGNFLYLSFVLSFRI
jgi:hypothetical protein